MSDLKSASAAEALKIADHMKVDEKLGTIDFSEDFYESTLEGTNLTLDQVKKIQKHDAKLLSATTLAAGEKAAEIFKENKDISEISFGYNAGHNKVNGFFSREGTTPVRNVVEVHGVGNRGELGKVYKHLKGLFDDIDS